MRVLAGHVLAIAIPLACPVASAQWHVVEDTPAGLASAINVAVVDNDSGHRVRVFRDATAVVRGEFSIGEGFRQLAADTCPTFHIDDNPPVAASNAEGPCRIDGSRATFELGEVRGEAIRADSLFWMMNGKRLVFLYRLERLGYHRTEFSLGGSKQALREALGHDVSVVAE